MNKIYDLIIIGSGPSGLSAGLYASRANLDTLILEKEQIGGQIVSTDEVANFPGSIENATGPSLIGRMVDQAKGFGVEIKIEEVISVDFSEKTKLISCRNNEYKARSVIVSTGASPRKLGVPGEKKFTGRGVAYCATCDAHFFTGLPVYVIGGGDSAVEEAIYITKFARKVTIVHRRDKLTAAKSIQERAFNNPNIEFIWDTEVKEIRGQGMVESMLLKNRETGVETECNSSEDERTFGIFPYVGYIPKSGLFKGILAMDNSGYLLTDENMKTNIDGVFASGDVRKKTLRQVVTAVADGAIAAVQAEKYIESNFKD